MPAISIDTTDDALIQEVAENFSGGQNSYTRAAQLQANQAALLKNVLIQLSGQLAKRSGTRDLFPGYVAGKNVIIQGLFYYDTVTASVLIAFAAGKAWSFDGLAWQEYFDAGIADHTERISVVQLTDNLYYTDAESDHINNWDGVADTVIGSSPPATMLEVMTNRVVAAGNPEVPDAVYFSDILDGDSWDLVNSSFRVGGGIGEPIIAISRWQQQTLLVFCRQGIYAVNCPPTSGPAEFSVATVHTTIGCVARRSVCQVGQDVWFLSRNGIMSVQKQIATSNDLVSIPVSQPVQDVIERIRWAHAWKSCAVCYNNYYLLSVPVASNEPDTVIVFNYLTGGFAVFDQWDALIFCEQPFEGTTRLLMGCSTGEVREWLDYLRTDQLEPHNDYKDGLFSIDLPFDLPITLPGGRPTEAIVVTRAMTFGDPSVTKNGWYLDIEVIQADGTLDIYAILDGEQTFLLRHYELERTNIVLPTTLPLLLPKRSSWISKSIPLHQLRRFKELQIKFVSSSGEFYLRRSSATAFINAYQTAFE